MRAGHRERGGAAALAAPLEEYALLGDTHSAALVRRDGCIDWLCLPRFDSDACFAALLGTPDHGSWTLGPASPARRVTRAYRPGSLVLETLHEVEGGILRVTDCMPPRGPEPDLVRVAECVEGEVGVRTVLRPRFGYGRDRPWVRGGRDAAVLVAGPDALSLRADVPIELRGAEVRARARLRRGERAAFVLAWHPSHAPPPPPLDVPAAIAETDAFWTSWSARCASRGPWREAVVRSLVTLKALTYAPTGGIVAAPTTSLPEWPGGARNWDYRFCWVRDATFTLYALLDAGYVEEAGAWRDWLLRAAAGDPSQLQMLYGVAGERRLPEWEVPWLPGYAGSRPVRIGNAAAEQLQLDVYGELMDCLHRARLAGLPSSADAWTLQRAVIRHVERIWNEPDEGIWELRSGRRHLVHSKVMAWVALDRAVQGVERLGLDGPVARWRALRRRIHDDVCARGFDARRGTFTQAYGRPALDASLLMIPLVGFLPVDDPRVAGTVEAIRRELLHDGLVLRYATDEVDDGVGGGEGAFLPCTFWLADCLALAGRRDEALEVFERLLALRNDVGLLAEEYDPVGRRLLGNFPQAFTHVGLVNTAWNLGERHGPAEDRQAS